MAAKSTMWSAKVWAKAAKMNDGSSAEAMEAKEKEKHRKESMKYLEESILPPVELQPLMGAKSFGSKSQTHAKATAGNPGAKRQDFNRMQAGASCIGNPTTDRHLTIVIQRAKAMISELRSVDAQLQVITARRFRISRPSDIESLEQDSERLELERRREILKAKLDRTVQTVQAEENTDVLLPDGTVGSVLWATFGVPGSEQRDVTASVQQFMKRGGICIEKVSCETLGSRPKASGGQVRILSIIYVGKPQNDVISKTTLGVTFTPRVDRPSEAAPPAPVIEKVVARRSSILGLMIPDHVQDQLNALIPGLPEGSHAELEESMSAFYQSALSMLCNEHSADRGEGDAALIEDAMPTQGTGQSKGWGGDVFRTWWGGNQDVKR